MVNPADLLFPEYTYIISFYPFIFLFYNINLVKKEIIEGYKNMFNIILNEQRIIEIKYYQYNQNINFHDFHNQNYLLKIINK